MDGIELSRDMADRMRDKPGGNAIDVTIGDMSLARTGRSYGLVYLVYNTIGNLLTQDDQVRCFQNAARHLADDGVFVLECRVPTAAARPGSQFVDAVTTKPVSESPCNARTGHPAPLDQPGLPASPSAHPPGRTR